MKFSKLTTEEKQVKYITNCMQLLAVNNTSVLLLKAFKLTLKTITKRRTYQVKAL